MKAKNVQRIVCAEGSQNIGPGRIASKPLPDQTGRQREAIIIQKPAPEVRNQKTSV